MIKIRITFILTIFLMYACSIAAPSFTDTPETINLNQMNRRLKAMQYTIQAGAFGDVNNAKRLEAKLDANGLDSYHFLDKDGLYKVRFGNFAGRTEAVATAKRLQRSGYIDVFYVVAPDEYEAAKPEYLGDVSGLRKAIVETAMRYIGVPYEWGGVSDAGFDCSGLTMAVYRLNGLDLPRVSHEQFEEGSYVSKDELQPGDLVFFDTRRLGRVSHVGIYIGNGKFVHAPSRGKHVRVENLDLDYFVRSYRGGRSYF
ncbi:NlpC/P60 family protein [Seleniivibrio woodruffii]|uniref:NlpC/P60 family protein n=1 Tax=Seleniivibrio woodruffii TaxID=1078050 RepID=UPI0026F099F4|nr:NlpC/P60 family protein [Seleniivibrio woodruffii]